MIYKFKSKAAGDVIMTGPNGDQLLRVLGRDPSPKGIVLPDDMPAAMQRLQKAIDDEEAARAQAEAEAKAAGQSTAPRDGFVSLRQRAWPFMEMLRRSHSAGKEIVWGV